MEKDLQSAIEALENGGIILLPSDTIWGLTCDATNEQAVEKIFQIKKRNQAKSLIALVDNEQSLLKIVPNPPVLSWDIIEYSNKPTTIIYDKAENIAQSAKAKDGSMAIRIVKDTFCRNLITKFKRPLISTSANISGEKSPLCFDEISNEIKNKVDYIVKHRQDEKFPIYPYSTIIKLTNDNRIEILRK